MYTAGTPAEKFAIDIVRQAAQLTRRVQTSMALEGLTKSDFSPVTVADYAVQAIVGHALAEQFPSEPLVGEETSEKLRTAEGERTLEVVTRFVGKITGGAESSEICDWIDLGAADPADCFWTLDPLDGTKGYLRGGQYAVALARVEHGQVTLGVLGCPNLGAEAQLEVCGLGALVVAVRGRGAWCAALDAMEEFQPLRVSETDDVKQARILRSFEPGHTNAGDIEAVAHLLGVTAEPVLMDSQAKYAVLSAGGAEMLFRFLSPKAPDYKEKIWDQAAGSIILEEAGGRVTDLRGHALDFRTGRTLENNIGLFATNGRLHEQGLQAIAEVCSLS